MSIRRALDLGADPLGHVLAEERRAVGQDHRELLAAEARHRVHRPDAVARARRATALRTMSPAGWPCASLTRLKWSMSIISTSAGSPARATRSTSLRERQLEVAAVGQAGERIAARQLAQAVDHRLQPGRVAGAAALRQGMARLLQQLQRAVEAERASIAERRVDLGRHEVGVSFEAV